jgi:3-oxoacyl-[acyl-carrier protein] reductase
MLTNRTCIVTGGANGIGEAIAEEFSRAGAPVVIADIDGAAGEAVAKRLRDDGRTVAAIQTDVSDEAAVARLIHEAGERFGRIDVLVNNAGIYPRHVFEETTTAQWDRIQAVNVRSAFLCAKAVCPWFKRQGGGKIINLSSVTFWLGQPRDLVHYIASKGAVIGLTRALARDLGEHNIQVNAITPGAVETEAERTVATPEQVASIVALQALKRRVSPRDIAKTALFLASSDSDLITGQTVNVDGGWAMH